MPLTPEVTPPMHCAKSFFGNSVRNFHSHLLSLLILCVKGNSETNNRLYRRVYELTDITYIK